ncbi:hypothetical protein SODALDRAFT_193960 [Sodiomyces alkalinus F11]|uniref:Uncharacterized protein n=1 Tax=Sodiomyces alkalinus (strain CBS 110278 / VKM F-3762 / F11) TaxID=1314773 RepID=A0A3N2PS23_SODAK|nr:hypothetical protein SODALDRAFT_193960 [Sodiomyces alkalinus F11]ROT37307.1 hypothetical protein SODALDRAFT_193960 [Sodiomyces alkalinus F11]
MNCWAGVQQGRRLMNWATSGECLLLISNSACIQRVRGKNDASMPASKQRERERNREYKHEKNRRGKTEREGKKTKAALTNGVLSFVEPNVSSPVSSLPARRTVHTSYVHAKHG